MRTPSRPGFSMPAAKPLRLKRSSVLKNRSGGGADPVLLWACDEGAPDGYGLHRPLVSLGMHRAVIAPSMIPRRLATSSRPTRPTVGVWPAWIGPGAGGDSGAVAAKGGGKRSVPHPGRHGRGPDPGPESPDQVHPLRLVARCGHCRIPSPPTDTSRPKVACTAGGWVTGSATGLPSGKKEYDENVQRSRITVTVRPQVLAAAEEEVAAGRASSVSAWVDQAMEEKARREELTVLLGEMQAENGPATPEEDAWARQVLGL